MTTKITREAKGDAHVPRSALHEPVPTSGRSVPTSQQAALLILDTDRWTDEGGSTPSDAPTPALVPAVARAEV